MFHCIGSGKLLYLDLKQMLIWDLNCKFWTMEFLLLRVSGYQEKKINAE